MAFDWRRAKPHYVRPEVLDREREAERLSRRAERYIAKADAAAARKAKEPRRGRRSNRAV